MSNELYQLHSPGDTAMQLAGRTRELRLARRWKQSTLAERSGVSLPSLRRFERTGEVSLKHLLLIVSALGRLGDFEGVLKPEEARSMRELESRANVPTPKRGSR